MDITERKEAEERQALLAREVDHRAKNAMAIVQSIVRLTKADSISEYANVIEGRIKALSRAHALLSDTRWQGAEMAKLVEEELAPYRSGHADRIRIAGPKVVLEPTTAQTLALALHELSTNAVKYGSLSQASGRLELNWDVLPDEIVVTWRESGGPAVQRPSQTGIRRQDHHQQHRAPARRQGRRSTGGPKACSASCAPRGGIPTTRHPTRW